MKRNQDCCKRYRKKGKACKDCPKVAALDKRERRKLLRRFKKK